MTSKVVSKRFAQKKEKTERLNCFSSRITLSKQTHGKVISARHGTIETHLHLRLVCIATPGGAGWFSAQPGEWRLQPR